MLIHNSQYSIPSGKYITGSHISFHTENLSFHYSALLTEILSLKHNTADPNFKQHKLGASTARPTTSLHPQPCSSSKPCTAPTNANIHVGQKIHR